MTAVNYNTPEYQRSNAAVTSGAIAAYTAGATGRGVKVAVIDSGINPNAAEFAGRIDPASRDVAGSRGMGDEQGHGTAAAGVIAANRNGDGLHGIAFDSSLLVFRADEPGSCADTSGDGCSFSDTNIARGVDAAVLAGAKVINLSLGGSAPGSNLLNSMSRAVTAGVVIVISAGNDGEKAEGVNADQFAAVPANRFPGHVIVAGAVGTSSGGATVGLDQLSSFSNRAGTSANNYLAAIGAGVWSVNKDGNQSRWSGTSFSAPAISGAAALLASAFPNLSGAQIVDILFKSADDLGAAGIDSVFGRGRLNITRAMQPLGTLSLAGSADPLSSTGSDAPAAAGDSIVRGASIGAVILDGYSRAFAVDLARTLRSAPRSEPLTARWAAPCAPAGPGQGRLPS
jgi:subtilisin family serine protease